jgi:hypothetical protein
VRARLIVAMCLAVAACAACDPVKDDKIAALGGEAPGVPRGPLHRPGQPCVLCHDGNVGDPPGFTVAGTVYVDPGDLTPAVGAVVSLTDSAGKSFDTTTNEVGNFWVLPHQFTPTYPMKVRVRYKDIGGDAGVPMTADVGRDGSCATCHFDPPGPASPGHVYIPPDGGTP